MDNNQAASVTERKRKRWLTLRAGCVENTTPPKTTVNVNAISMLT
jgi:hypothetical protein